MNSRFDPALISISTSKVDPNVVGLKVIGPFNLNSHVRPVDFPSCCRLCIHCDGRQSLKAQIYIRHNEVHSSNVLLPQVLDTVNRTVLAGRPNNAAFITSCHEHCGQWAQGQILEGHDDFNVTIDGWTAPFALDSWAAGVWAGQTPARTVWVQKHLYPCDDCCSGGN